MLWSPWPVELPPHGQKSRFTKGSEKLGGLEPDQPKAELLRGGNGYRWFPGDSSPKVSCIPEDNRMLAFDGKSARMR